LKQYQYPFLLLEGPKSSTSSFAKLDLLSSI
jgi:hypothetical protein